MRRRRVELNWLFSKKTADETHSNDTKDEHFKGGVAHHVVKEGIQNSLDARPKPNAGYDYVENDEPVRVRIFVSGSSDVPSYNDVKHIFEEEFINHASSKGAGLNDPPSIEDPCPYLVFEDFQTTGLIGDTEMHQSPLGQDWENPFYCFVRANAFQTKTSGDKGSWGVGKTVFPSCSRFSTTLFKSVRLDDLKTIYMGRAIFKHHQIEGDEDTFRPDAWFCEPTDMPFLPRRKFAMPIEDADDLFQPFNISRTDESGLSIVVPYIDKEEFTFQKLLAAVLEIWAFAIINEKLIVEIVTEIKTQEVNKSTIDDSVQLIEDEAFRDNLLSLVSIAIDHTSDLPEECCFELLDQYPYKNADGTAVAPHWVGPNRQEWIPEELSTKMAEALQSYETLKVTIPLQIERIKDPAYNERAYFTVLFKPKLDFPGGIRPFPYRDGLLVKGDVNRRKPKAVLGHNSVIWVGENEECKLAEMLRDAEDPSHTSWNSTSKKFYKKYSLGSKAKIDFVRNSAHYIMSCIIGDEVDDFDVFADLVGLPTGVKKKSKVPEPPPPPPPPPLPKTHKIRTGRGKFVVSAGEENFENIESLTIRAAYDVIRGNPLKQYKYWAQNGIYDFKFDEDIEIETTDCEITSIEPNEIQLKVTSQNFKIEVFNFDLERDIFAVVTEERKEGVVPSHNEGNVQNGGKVKQSKVPRSDAIFILGYYLSKFSKSVTGRNSALPPKGLGLQQWGQVSSKFYPAIAVGRTKTQFHNTLMNTRDEFDIAISSDRVGWKKELASKHLEIISEHDDMSEDELCAKVSSFLEYEEPVAGVTNAETN